MAKIKTCSFCGATVSKLWYSSPPCCANYACKSRYNESKSKKGTISPKQKKRPLNRISDKELKRLAEYRPLRDKFLEGKTCQFPGCNSPNVTLHHAGGRLGDNLTKVETFRALCPYHHDWVETHPEEAKEMNLSINRL